MRRPGIARKHAGVFYLFAPLEPSPAMRVIWPGGSKMSWFFWFIGTIMVALLALIGFMVWIEKNRE